MISLSTLAVIAAGVVIGLLLGLTGGGGSILTVPLLVYVVGLDAKVAIATSLLIVGITSLAAVVSHSRCGNVFWRTGGLFGLAGMAGAYSGGSLAQFMSDTLLLLLFAAVMLGSGLAMLKKKAATATPGLDPAVPSPRKWIRVVSDGFVVGIVTGLVGAGGGFLVVPALALLGGMPMHAAVGTSLMVIAMKCFAGLAGYTFISHIPVDVTSAAIVSAFAIVGTTLGTRLSRAVSAEHLQRGFGVFVLLVAAILIVIEGSALLARVFAADRLTVGIVMVGVGCLVIIPLIVKLLNSGAAAHPQH